MFATTLSEITLGIILSVVVAIIFLYHRRRSRHKSTPTNRLDAAMQRITRNLRLDDVRDRALPPRQQVPDSPKVSPKAWPPGPHSGTGKNPAWYQNMTDHHPEYDIRGNEPDSP